MVVRIRPLFLYSQFDETPLEWDKEGRGGVNLFGGNNQGTWDFGGEEGGWVESR